MPHDSQYVHGLFVAFSYPDLRQYWEATPPMREGKKMTDMQGGPNEPQETTHDGIDMPPQPGYGQQQYVQPPYDQQQYNPSSGQQSQYGQSQYGQYDQTGQTTGQQQYNQSPSGQQPQYNQYGQQQPEQPAGPNPWPYFGANGAMAGGPGDPYGQGGPYGPGGPYGSSTAPTNMEPPLNQPYYRCPFPQAIARFFRKYVDFNGRASRSEYWWVALGCTIVYTLLDFINDRTGHFGWLEALFTIAVFLPSIAVAIRRLHDSNRSGWWIALPVGLWTASIISVIILIALFALRVGSALSLRQSAVDVLSGAGTSIIIWACIAVVCWLAAIIIYIILMVARPNPLGARFDEHSVPQQQLPVNQAMPVNAQYGNAYPQGQNPAGMQSASPYQTPAPYQNPVQPLAGQYQSPVPQQNPVQYQPPQPEQDQQGSQFTQNPQGSQGPQPVQDRPSQESQDSRQSGNQQPLQ